MRWATAGRPACTMADAGQDRAKLQKSRAPRQRGQWSTSMRGPGAASTKPGPQVADREPRAPNWLGRDALRQVALHLVERDALLAHGVAVSDGHRVVVEGLEVDCHAE